MTDQHDPHTAALPTPGAGPAMRMLAVAAIVASTTNPRKTFNTAKLHELAESIKASGVHQPVLVRLLPADRLADTYIGRRQGEPLPTHEMVAGERRWRGCQLAGVGEIPAMIRELTDTQVLEAKHSAIATNNVATRAYCISARGLFDSYFAACYSAIASAKKVGVGIGVPKHRCDESRSSSAEPAASLSVPPFLAARMGSRKARRFAQAVPGTPTRSSCRLPLAWGAVVFANRTAWRPPMAAQSQSAARQHITPEVHKLRNTVEFMDALSQGGFSEISSIAKLALARLETPDGYSHLDDIANALSAIWGKADEIQNCISSEAEQVGCHYTDEAQCRRWAAQHAHREAKGA